MLRECKTNQDANLWDEWIGKGEFELSYLEKIFSYPNVTVVELVEEQSSVGVMVFRNKMTNVSEILLIARKKDTNARNITRKLLKFEKLGYIKMLDDDSQNPGFYQHIGFSKITFCCQPDMYMKIG